MTDKTQSQLDALKALDAMRSSTPSAPARPKEQPKGKPAATRKPESKKAERAARREEEPPSGRSIGRMISKTLRGDVLDSSIMRKQVGLIMLIAIYMLTMVYMRYQVEALQKDKIATLKRIEYLNEHRIEIRKQYQKAVMISTISETLAEKGISTISGPPYEL